MAKRNSQFPETSDEKLVVATLLGDMAAFDELVRRFRGAAIYVAEQVLGSRDAAEDVAQEAFLLAFKALPQLQDPTRFAGWLCAITRQRARRVGRRDGRSEATESSTLDRLLIAHSHELVAHPADVLLRKGARADLSKALALLPPEFQIVLKLRYYEEWSVDQIATFLLLPHTTVKWRLHRGRELLRRQLAEQEETNEHERQQSPRSGNKTGASAAKADGPPRRTRQHDRQPEQGRACCGAAL